MCQGCSRFFFAEEDGEEPLELFLAGLPVPVLVVGPVGEVQAANTAARELAGLAPGELAGLRSGDVIACANAGRPEGCGHTENCPGCVVRRTVEATYTSGESQEVLSGPREMVTPEGIRRVRLRIATRKRGGAVLLRIDEVEDLLP
jgi:PAS domain-containing protein